MAISKAGFTLRLCHIGLACALGKLLTYALNGPIGFHCQTEAKRESGQYMLVRCIKREWNSVIDDAVLSNVSVKPIPYRSRGDGYQCMSSDITVDV